MKNCILIIGFGKSGKWAYNLALKLGYMPLIFDDRFVKIENCWLSFDLIDFAVVSPGVPPTHTLIENLRNNNIKIISEIEFCYLAREEKSPIIGVTGTNGKTTVTEMIGAVLGENAVVAGNIGKPWSEAVVKDEHSKYTLLELSSFQLNNVYLFHPHIAVLTNFAPDHIDYHGSYDSYVDAKMNLVRNMRADDFVLYNGEDVEVKKRVQTLGKVRTLYFSEERCDGEGIYLQGGRNIVFCFGGEERVVYTLPVGHGYKKHIILNMLASTLVALLVGVDDRAIEKALLNFKPSRFRQERIENSLDIKIINDSKATNLGAVLVAISENKPDVLLVGGRGKTENYSRLFQNAVFHHLVVYGEMREEIIDCAKENNFQDVVAVKNFDDAVNCAIDLTKQGETLLFSPAGSSFDQFSSYKERGERFNYLVRNLKNTNS